MRRSHSTAPRCRRCRASASRRCSSSACSALVTRIWERPIPFFRRKLEAAGLTPRDVRSLDDLRAIPTTVKDDLRASEAEHPPLGDYRGSTHRRVRAHRLLDRHQRPADDHLLDAPRSGDRSRSGVPRPLALGAAAGLEPGARPSRSASTAAASASARASRRSACSTCRARRRAPARGRARWCACWPLVKPEHYRFFGNAGAQYADAARAAGYDPERDLNLRVQGEDPKEQYKSVSAGLEALGMLGTACDADDGAHVAEDLAIAEVIDRRSGQAGRRRRARQPGGDGAGEGQRLPALRPAGHRAPQPASRARAARRTSASSTKGA